MSTASKRLEKLRGRLIPKFEVLGLDTPWFDGFNSEGEALSYDEQVSGFVAAKLAYQAHDKGAKW